ncbi:hypothetical protein G9A89_020725 [Geosiphon pyriformis]|nr:hypothetical protein G9A89_020725 [Geosiphon pyriformis]
MAYALIAKLKKFTSKEDDTQIWLNDVEKTIMANGWNNTRAFQAIFYFLQNTIDLCNNNSINQLANTFTTIKQEETKAVTTYLECFHRNLRQIQAINANYFTVTQILNQFICRLHSSILQCIHPIYPIDLQAAVTNARDFEAAKLEATHTQAVNLVMNRSSDLDSKLKQFKTQIVSKINCIYHCQPINSGNRKCMFVTIVVNKGTYKSTATVTYITNDQEINIEILIAELLTYDTATTLLTTSILSANSSTNDTSNLSATVTTHLLAVASDNLSALTNSNTATELTSKWNPKVKINPTKLEIINGSSPTDFQFFHTTKDIQSNNPKTNQQTTLTSNISPATITENKSLDAIFSFELEELHSKKKPITAIYTDVKVDGHSIKLILDSASTDSIITRQLMDQLATKTPIGEIDDFPIEVNGIIVLIKVLVIEATQYQALKETDKEKRKKKEENITKGTTTTEEITSGWEREYLWKPIKKPPYIPLKCKWDNEPCLACSKQLLDEGMWNNIPG